MILWGASIHANRAIERTVRDPDGIASVIAFSPGEYGQNSTIRPTASRLQRRTFLLFGRDEEDVVAQAVPETLRTVYRSAFGRHGPAILFDEPQAWKAVKEFLESVTKAQK